jgi:hypothetical protein
MRDEGVSRYRNTNLVASDVGFIGYFTGARICDLAGLVNGRQQAMRSSIDRQRMCAESKPQLLFLNDSQLRSMSPYVAGNKWRVVSTFDFRKVSGNDRHFLVSKQE